MPKPPRLTLASPWMLRTPNRPEARRDDFAAVAAWMARDPDSEMFVTGSSMN